MVYHKTIPQVELKTSGGFCVLQRNHRGIFLYFSTQKNVISTILNHISHLGGIIIAFST